MSKQDVIPAATPDGAVVDLAHLLGGIHNLAGILIVRSDGVILYANSRFGERWEVAPEFTTTGSHAALVEAMARSVADPDALLSRVAEHERSPDLVSCEEVTLRSGRILQRASAPVRRVDGLPYGRAWYVRDITDHKRAALDRAQAAAVIARLTDALAAARIPHAERVRELLARDRDESVAGPDLLAELETLLNGTV